MKKVILSFCAIMTLSITINAQTKKDTKVKTEKVSKSQSKILENGTAKIENLDAYEVYGQSFNVENTLTKNELGQLYDNMKKGDVIENVQFVSTIESVCKKKGCFMYVDLGKEKEQSFVRFKDYGFFMPLDSEESSVVVHGKAFVSELSVEKLRHYAKDQGKSEVEIAKITKPQLLYNFEADGVFLREK